MNADSREQSLRDAREEEAALALWSTLHPGGSEAQWRRLPEAARQPYRRVARQALGFDPHGFDAHGVPAYAPA